MHSVFSREADAADEHAFRDGDGKRGRGCGGFLNGK